MKLVTILPNGMIYVAAAANRVYDVKGARDLIAQLTACITEITPLENRPVADPVSPTGADLDRSGAAAYRHGDPVAAPTTRKRRGGG
jgi:hypothetical protein